MNIPSIKLWNWNIIIPVLALIIAIICGAVAYHYYQLHLSDQQSKNLIVASKDNFNVPLTKGKRDSTGVQHYQATANQNTYSASTIKNNPTISLGGADTTAKILGIQNDQIIYWQQIASILKSDNLKAHKAIDSMGNIVRYYRNKNLYVAYHYPKSSDTSDAGYFDINEKSTITFTQYYSKKFLGIKYHPLIDIYPGDSSVDIKSLRLLSITPNAPLFALKAQVKTTYDFASKSIIPSARAIFSVGNFDFAGGYYYSGHYQRLEPIVSAAYNFINIK